MTGVTFTVDGGVDISLMDSFSKLESGSGSLTDSFSGTDIGAAVPRSSSTVPLFSASLSDPSCCWGCISSSGLMGDSSIGDDDAVDLFAVSSFSDWLDSPSVSDDSLCSVSDLTTASLALDSGCSSEIESSTGETETLDG